MTQHTDSVEAVVKEFEQKFTSDGQLLLREDGGYDDITDWMLKRLTTLQATQSQQVEEAVRKRNGVIKEYKDEGVMFVLKVEDGKTYEASMPIPKWAEVGKLTLRDHEHDWVPCPGTVCTSDLHTHHCSICRKHAYQPVTPNHQD